MTRRVHLLGVGGVGMAGLAVLLKARGYEVSGCDLSESARTRWLATEGIPVSFGHSPAHLDGVDEVIVTPAVRRDEPELLAAGRVRYRGEVLAELASAADSIAVCGSHGKTTTATFIAKLLRELGEDVGWCIGGETGDFPVARAAKGPLVVEADESDGTLALYRAKTLVVNRCEYDHPDHFPTAADYFACFERAKTNASTVIESELLPEDPRFASALAGLAPHNRRNARAAIEVALRRGHAPEKVLAALPVAVAELPDRRFQRLAEGVYTDYAHHPTEMKCAIGMARAICRGCLRVLFQPHRYSRTRALVRDFPAAFAAADEVVLCPTYAAFERPVEGGDVADLYAECRAAGVRVALARSCDEAWEHAALSRAEGDLTLILGAGDIIRLASRVNAPLPPRRRILIGAGANTWRSELKTLDDYVRSETPAGAPGATLGIPWMAGIPGTIGGWVKMNAGAFGHSISEVLTEVKVDGRWLKAEECGFGYRFSRIDGEIQDVRLKPLVARAGEPVAADYLARRRKFPAGTWGSVFKNPPNDFAGRLLEAVGAKDMRVGGAYVWAEHANVIVCGDGATPSDALALARLMRLRVLHRLGIALEPEVCGLSLLP